MIRLSGEARSLMVSDSPLLTPTPSDPLMAFLARDQTHKLERGLHWSIRLTDLENVRKTEVERQNFMHEIITSESWFLHSLQVLRYFYIYRLKLDFSIRKKATLEFPGSEDIYHANKTLLYDPLKSRQASDGPWLSTVSDIFHNWLKQSGVFYVKYASRHPVVSYDVRKEAKENARFSLFLDQSREQRHSERLTWDSFAKSPFTRLEKYCLLLQTILKNSDPSDPSHGCGKLEQLIEDMRGLVARCDVALKQSSERVEISDLRNRLGDVEMRILPDNVEIQLTQKLFYKESLFRDMVEVIVLAIRKPVSSVMVLKEISRDKVSFESDLEVLADVSSPKPPRTTSINGRAASGPPSCPYRLHKKKRCKAVSV